MVSESGNRHPLHHILGIDGAQKPLTWFGDGQKELKEEKQRGIYDEEQFYMDFEEDEEHISRGSDRKRIKVMQVDFKKEGAGGRNARNSQDIRESELQCITDFDFIYDCPMIREFGEDNFMRVNFGKNVPNVTVKKVLNRGLKLKDPLNTGECVYKFCAHSPSQLRNRSCIFVNYDALFWSVKFPELTKLNQIQKRSERHKLIKPTYIYNYFGTFDQKVVAKYAARVGLLLSPTAQAVFIPDGRWGREPDWKTEGDLEFTDGCGRMSTWVADQFKQQMDSYATQRYAHQAPYYVPSVIQFRMMGCKGILMHDPTLDGTDKDVMLRDSQWKFDWNMDTVKGREIKDGVVGRSLGKCARGESRPFQFGRLNKQYVLMLSALGIKDEVFLDIQEEHFDRLRRCLDDRKQAFEILCGNGKMDEADELLQLHDEDPMPRSVITQLKRFRKPVTEMPINPGYDKQEDKDTENSAFYIPIRKSRNIYGVADITRKLKCRECFVQVTEHADEGDMMSHSSYRRARPRMKVKTIPDGTRIVVVKCPTYYPGDIRILTHRNVPELSHLVDVIVFPTDPEMKRPHPHEIHESDLDGDEYFVCWDEKLVPEQEQRPMATVVKEKVDKKDTVQICDVIEAFATNDAIMGQVNNTFMRWADFSPHGANSEQCKELARIFAQSVDGAKHGGAAHIPENLNARDIAQEEKPDLVQHEMLKQVKQQPYRSAYDKLVRYNGLNCRFRPKPANATYFMADMERTSPKQNCADFFAMVKYGLFATRNEELMKQLNQGPVGPLTFGASTLVVAFERHRNLDGTNTMKLVGLAQIQSKWQPFEWQESPFTFGHHGAFVAKWLYCREFTAPPFIYITAPTGLAPLETLKDGDRLDKTAGNLIFDLFAKTPLEHDLPYAKGPTTVLVNEDFGRVRWAKEERQLQEQVRRMRNKYQPQQKSDLKQRKPKN